MEKMMNILNIFYKFKDNKSEAELDKNPIKVNPSRKFCQMLWISI